MILLELPAAASAADRGIYKKKFGMTAFITLNEEINKIIKIFKSVKSLEKSGFSITGAIETIKNKAKEENGGFFSML